MPRVASLREKPALIFHFYSTSFLFADIGGTDVLGDVHTSQL